MYVRTYVRSIASQGHGGLTWKLDVFNAMYVDMPSKGGMRPGAEFLTKVVSIFPVTISILHLKRGGLGN